MKTKEQIETQILNYLTKTSLHLFTTEKGELYKIFPFQVKDKWYYITIKRITDNYDIRINEVTSDQMFKYYGNDLPNYRKHDLFPNHNKTKSIPNFKQMREAVELIKKELINHDHSTITNDSVKNKNKIKFIFGDLKIKEVVKVV